MGTQGFEALAERRVRHTESHSKLGLLEAQEQQLKGGAQGGGEDGERGGGVLALRLECEQFTLGDRGVAAHVLARAATLGAAREEGAVSSDGPVGDAQEGFAFEVETTPPRGKQDVLDQVLDLMSDTAGSPRSVDEGCADVSQVRHRLRRYRWRTGRARFADERPEAC